MTETVFEVFNTSGSLVLSHRAKQVILKSKGRHSVTTGATTGPVGTRSVLTVTCSPAGVIALRPVSSGIGAAVYLSQSSGGQRSFSIMCEGASSQQLDWWLFDAPDAYNPGSNVRFELFKQGTSELAWRLYSRPMKVVGTFASDSSALLTAQSITVPGGAAYAVAPGNPSGRVQDQLFGGVGNNYRTRVYWDATSWAGTSLSFGLTLLDTETGSHVGAHPTVNYGPRNALVIDVTGL